MNDNINYFLSLFLVCNVFWIWYSIYNFSTRLNTVITPHWLHILPLDRVLKESFSYRFPSWAISFFVFVLWPLTLGSIRTLSQQGVDTSTKEGENWNDTVSSKECINRSEFKHRKGNFFPAGKQSPQESHLRLKNMIWKSIKALLCWWCVREVSFYILLVDI